MVVLYSKALTTEVLLQRLEQAEGDAIAVRVRDADTGELLAQQPAVVQVDLDW